MLKVLEVLGWSKSLFSLSLTSFVTILLDCIMTAVIAPCILQKSLSKWVNFCTAILMLKIEATFSACYVLLFQER